MTYDMEGPASGGPGKVRSIIITYLFPLTLRTFLYLPTRCLLFPRAIDFLHRCIFHTTQPWKITACLGKVGKVQNTSQFNQVTCFPNRKS
ncbi:hypothetical protein K469DRAFT_130676 [Zopfia rhizophila CBS 207.26]|uniref:Uncharacterized protein n=1 Tax=Zopfia rhizophila CBS 207.26 TaxID=1314779 RepID=A0A6A6EXG7_9PEZI|nr:hypothetical protein K469DRAFT_130676 [Zopfia rhizophila CBS 207.26]